ncbi:outer membrane beta-barrel protein [Hymenobacter terrenus]|uniref:outer membrane beta-barrel protein n=1 Tax=Hymenobacter terrenus TaxID=1629124 RepID=UPI0018CD7894|nr:outer membrane beta-barrel protein [Hymenobacter terrenus]
MKNLFTVLFLTTSLAGAATTAHAQTAVTFGARLGFNSSSFSYSGTPPQLNKATWLMGLHVGGTANISFGNLAFQPAIIFTQKGAELKSSGKEVFDGAPITYSVMVSPKLTFIELPLNMVYTSGGDHGFQIFAGPYVALGVGGRGSYDFTFSTTDPNLAVYNGSYPGPLKIEYGNRQNANNTQNTPNPTSAPPLILTFHRFDAGLNGGVGYRVGSFQVQLGYGLGLVNFVPKDTDGTDTGSKRYHRSFQLSASYFFDGK